MIKASICMATRNRPALLRRTLESIYRQKVPFEFETVIANDGSHVDYGGLAADFPAVRWLALPPFEGRRNPAAPRNAAYLEARSSIIIAQSDEVIHATPNAVELLVEFLEPGRFLLATTYNVDPDGNHSPPITNERRGPRCYVSPRVRRPLFFLGSLWRDDLYAVGGCDETFPGTYCEDSWFADCLVYGRHLRPMYTSQIVGHHQDHPRIPDMEDRLRCRRHYFSRRRRAFQTGIWQAQGSSCETFHHRAIPE